VICTSRPTGRGRQDGAHREAVRRSLPSVKSGSTAWAGRQNLRHPPSTPHSMTGRFPRLTSSAQARTDTEQWPMRNILTVLYERRLHRRSPCRKPFQTREAQQGCGRIDWAEPECVSKRTWRWSCRACWSELKEKPLRAQRYGRVLCRTGTEANAAGIPNRSDRGCANKHCVPCWNRSSTVIPSVELLAKRRASGGPSSDQAKSATVFISPLPASTG